MAMHQVLAKSVVSVALWDMRNHFTDAQRGSRGKEQGLLHATPRTLLEPLSAPLGGNLRKLEGFVDCSHPDLQRLRYILDPRTLFPE